MINNQFGHRKMLSKYGNICGKGMSSFLFQFIYFKSSENNVKLKKNSPRIKQHLTYNNQADLYCKE